MKNFRLLLFAALVFSGRLTFSQSPGKIKFAKDSKMIFFFQKGPKNDTLVKNKSDLFYLVVPDSMKSSFSLSAENSRLTKTSNDSIYQLEHMPGLKYETFFVKKEIPVNRPGGPKAQKNTIPQFEIKTLINGTAEKEKNLILIRITDKKDEKLMLENNFYFLER